MALTNDDKYILQRMRGWHSNWSGDFEETTGMVSSTLGMSVQELVQRLAQIKQESSSDDDYRAFRVDLPAEWPMWLESVPTHPPALDQITGGNTAVQPHQCKEYRPQLTIKTALALVLILALATACTSPGQDPSAVQRGAESYTASCQSCHGDAATGAGRILTAPSHGPDGHTWHHADGLLTDIVLGAFQYPGRAMPSFEGQLSRDEVNDILSFFKTNWTEEQLSFQAEVSQNWENAQ
jgi:mono/diheme cytochrome c family protein